TNSTPRTLYGGVGVLGKERHAGQRIDKRTAISLSSAASVSFGRAIRNTQMEAAYAGAGRSAVQG
ncbi:MAG TPA: hypothetical protein PLY11_13955, partial [Syntrophorhabdus sp.]|nr:hypothetical protein [Syntrophorhabdus sp.]